MNWEYTERKATGQLGEWIDCIWKDDFFNKCENQGNLHKIFPDNSVELIISTSTMHRKTEAHEEAIIVNHISGLRTKPQEITRSESALLGIRMKPEMLYLFSDIPIHETVDKAINLHDIFGKTSDGLIDLIMNEIEPEKRSNGLERFFLDLLKNRSSRMDKQFHGAIKLIQDHQGVIPVSVVAASTGMSIKTMERKFKQKLGLSPKLYSRLIRTVGAIQKSQNTRMNLTEIAYKHKYYDQMHFVKEVKQFTGFTPSKFYKLDKGIQTPTFS